MPPRGPQPHQTLLFIGGLHRSGTTPLAHCLAAHPEVSGLTGTGVTEDEGQHLQNVYPVARTYGGPGRFALDRRSHLTEDSALATSDAAERLWRAWSPYWQLDKRVLLEKSPPNLVMTRFLARLFPTAMFLIVARHPVVTTLATAKWTGRTPLFRVMDNWFAAHRVFLADARHLVGVKVISYEALTRRPEETLTAVGQWLSLSSPIQHAGVRSDRSSTYEEQWQRMQQSHHLPTRASHRWMHMRHHKEATRYGYDLNDLSYEGPSLFDTVGQDGSAQSRPGDR